MISKIISLSNEFLTGKKITRQFLKYSIVGVFNTIIGFGTIFIFYNIFGVHYILANILGYSFGLTNSFIWNKRWTFRSSGSSSKEVIPFLTVFVVSYCINLFITISSVEILKLDPNVAQILGIISYTVINFFANRRWTFLHIQR